MVNSAMEIKSKILGFLGAVGLLLTAATTSNAAVFNTIAEWDAVSKSNIGFGVSADSTFDFWAVCPLTSGGCGAANLPAGSDTGPNAASANLADINTFMQDNSPWDLVAVQQQITGSNLSAYGDKSGTLTSASSHLLWLLKFDNALIALAFKDAVSEVTFWGLPNGLSNLYLGFAKSDEYPNAPVDTVPVPAALPLLASAFGALGFVGWRRKRAVKAA